MEELSQLGCGLRKQVRGKQRAFGAEEKERKDPCAWGEAGKAGLGFRERACWERSRWGRGEPLLGLCPEGVYLRSKGRDLRGGPRGGSRGNIH